MGQLLYGQRISMLVHIAINLGTVVFKVIGSFQLDALLTVNNRVSQFGDNLPLCSATFI